MGWAFDHVFSAAFYATAGYACARGVLAAIGLWPGGKD